MDHLGIAFSGKQFSGKTTTALTTCIELRSRGLHPERVSFATPLKDATHRVLGAAGVNIAEWQKERLRPCYQAIGETLREYDPSVWIHMGGVAANRLIWKGDFPIFDDMRYINEFEALSELGFMTVRLEASPFVRSCRGTLVGEEHESETELDTYRGKFDVVYNYDAAPRTQEEIAKFVVEQLFAGHQL